MPRAQTVAPAIRVAFSVADRSLAARLLAACEETDGTIVIASAEDALDDADIVVADHRPDTTTPVIAVVADTAPPSWQCDVRAVVPPDTDAIGAVIRVVAAGLTVMPRGGIGCDAWPEAHTPPPLDHLAIGDDEPALTPREREVLALLTEGASNKDIARALGLSIHTAKFHVASITEKLGASGRLEAVAIAIRSGLVMV